MMMKAQKYQDSRTGIRFSKDQRETIEKLVAEGKFESISQVVRAALAEFLPKQ